VLPHKGGGLEWCFLNSVIEDNVTYLFVGEDYTGIAVDDILFTVVTNTYGWETPVM
jgi:hypothetical protein